MRRVGLVLMLAAASLAQQPSTTTLAVTTVNAKWTNGTAPGYWVTPLLGLSVHVSPGTAFCSGALVTYAGGSISIPANATGYVYLNTAGQCAPAVKFTPFTSADLPVAIVVMGPAKVSSVTDARTMFQWQAPVTVPSAMGGLAIDGTTASCRNWGGTFGGVGCVAIRYRDNHWNGPGSLSTLGLILNIEQLGGGQSGAEETGTGGGSINLNSLWARPGIVSSISDFSQKHAVGDTIWRNYNNWSRAGVKERSDQGVNDTQDVGGEPVGAPTFTLDVAQPGTQHPTWNTGAGIQDCKGGPWCFPSAGGMAQSRTELLATVHFSDTPNHWAPGISYPAGTTAAVDGVDMYTALVPNSGVQPGTDPAVWAKQRAWLNVSAVAETSVPLTTATCTAWAVNLIPNVASDNPIPQTFTCQQGSGTFSVGQFVAVAGGAGPLQGQSGHYEGSKITAVSGVAPHQTITLPLSAREYDIAIFAGGLAGSSGCEAAYEAMAGFTSGGFPNCPPWPVLGSLDGHSVIYYMPAYGSGLTSGLPIASIGNDPTTYGGASDPTALFNVYCSAQIASFASRELNPLVENLEPNPCAWPAGGTVVHQDFPVQNIYHHWEGVTMTGAATPRSGLSAFFVFMAGAASFGNAFGFDVDNAASDCFLYAPSLCKNMRPPYAAFCAGCYIGNHSYFQNLLSVGLSPQNSLIKVGQMFPGQTMLNLFDVPHGCFRYLDNEPGGGWDNTCDGAGHFQTSYIHLGKSNPYGAIFIGVSAHYPFNKVSFGTSVDLNNGFVPGDVGIEAGSVTTDLIEGPAPPSGACTTVGWAFANNGHAYFCDGSVWTMKL